MFSLSHLIVSSTKSQLLRVRPLLIWEYWNLLRFEFGWYHGRWLWHVVAFRLLCSRTLPEHHSIRNDDVLFDIVISSLVKCAVYRALGDLSLSCVTYRSLFVCDEVGGCALSICDSEGVPDLYFVEVLQTQLSHSYSWGRILNKHEGTCLLGTVLRQSSSRWPISLILLALETDAFQTLMINMHQLLLLILSLLWCLGVEQIYLFVAHFDILFEPVLVIRSIRSLFQSFTAFVLVCDLCFQLSFGWMCFEIANWWNLHFWEIFIQGFLAYHNRCLTVNASCFRVHL